MTVSVSPSGAAHEAARGDSDARSSNRAIREPRSPDFKPVFTNLQTFPRGVRTVLIGGGELWDYNREGWARRIFDNWRNQLRWQRLKTYEKFARMINRNWDGIAANCGSETKFALRFVEGPNKKVRVIQRRAYGLRDEEYLRLKVLTCMLEPLPKRLGSTHSKVR